MDGSARRRFPRSNGQGQVKIGPCDIEQRMFVDSGYTLFRRRWCLGSLVPLTGCDPFI